MGGAQITVVIATRDRAASLRRTLRELHAAAPPPPVIVVDNGSRDGTADMLGAEFPSVRVLRLRRNEGAPARNRGVAAAETPYVAFADDDSWWAPGALRQAAAHFERHPRLGLLAARTLVGPGERLDPISAFMAAAPLGTADDLPGPSVLGFLACAAVVRRDAFLACGGFDPVVFFMGEEARLAYDLHRAGWGLAYCDDVVAHHRPGPPSPGAAKQLLARRNHALTTWMRRPLRAATAETVALLRAGLTDPGSRRAAAQLLVRLPGALARRRPPDPAVEHALHRLAAAEDAVRTR